MRINDAVLTGYVIIPENNFSCGFCVRKKHVMGNELDNVGSESGITIH